MRIKIVVTDDDGNSWDHEVQFQLGAPVRGGRRMPSRPRDSAMPTGRDAVLASELDFSLPLRAFIKRHGMSLSGPKKFCLLLARLTNGDEKGEVARSVIEQHWNKMTALMGGRFNPAHASRARDDGWVDTPKHGMYKLCTDWRRALSDG
jgi:hypothetical protein